MKFDEIMGLMQAIGESDMTEFQIKKKDFSLSVKRNPSEKKVCSEQEEFQKIEESKGLYSDQIVKSPLVGVFHSSEAADSKSFVMQGDRVEAGQVLGMIEAMKLMNDVVSEYTGSVSQVLVQDGQLVEFGQSLFVIEE